MCVARCIDRFGEFTVTIVRDMIMPNCVWTAGRTAAAIRKAAVACLWALVRTQLVTDDQVDYVMQHSSNTLLVMLIMTVSCRPTRYSSVDETGERYRLNHAIVVKLYHPSTQLPSNLHLSHRQIATFSAF